MVPIILIITAIIISLIYVLYLIRKLYRNELKRKGYFDDFYYEYESVECPHTKRIKFSDTNWKTHFTAKKEKSITVQRGLTKVKVKRTLHRLFCDECGKKRWFKEANSMQEAISLTVIRVKYMLLLLIALVVLTNIFVTILNWLL